MWIRSLLKIRDRSKKSPHHQGHHRRPDVPFSHRVGKDVSWFSLWLDNKMLIIIEQLLKKEIKIILLWFPG